MAYLQKKYSEATELMELILFLYEESFSYDFKILEGNDCCLDPDYNPYAKTLFTTVLQFIDLLGKKGCYRSALEYNKFLIKLNPLLDPTGGLLLIDTTAIAAGESEFLQEFPMNFCQELYGSEAKFSVMFLPNFLYSIALTKFLDNFEEEDG